MLIKNAKDTTWHRQGRSVFFGITVWAIACGGCTLSPSDPAPEVRSRTQPASAEMTERYGIVQYRIDEYADGSSEITALDESINPVASMQGRKHGDMYQAVLTYGDSEVYLEPAAGDGTDGAGKVDGVPIETAALQEGWPAKAAVLELWSTASSDLAPDDLMPYGECWATSNCLLYYAGCSVVALACPITGLATCGAALLCYATWRQHCVTCDDGGSGGEEDSSGGGGFGGGECNLGWTEFCN